jgi:2-dehydro-3-deoxygluconokinase
LATAVFLGEAMLELSQDSDRWRLGYGGDTLNTAIHMARTGIETAYMTAVGNDALSQTLAADWAVEGLDPSLVLTHPTRATGLYAISTDDRGERSFSYWRDTSAARALFELAGVDAAVARAAQAGLFAFSLISLAILPPSGRQRLLSLAAAVRAHGGKVAFDGNYRPRLWANEDEAIAARDAAIKVADIGLPTLEDEAMLSGESSADAVAAHWMGLGCPETIVKLGAQGCRLPNGAIVPPPDVLAPVDTSGAGDAFNGGYLSARLKGSSIADAAVAGHRLAGWCVMRRGAIPPRDDALPG